jgi:hypothetical protein
MSKVTELASASINGHDTISVELIETDQTPAVVIVRWPIKPSVFHPPLPGAADSAACVFAAAAVRLAAIKRERRL